MANNNPTGINQYTRSGGKGTKGGTPAQRKDYAQGIKLGRAVQRGKKAPPGLSEYRPLIQKGFSTGKTQAQTAQARVAFARAMSRAGKAMKY